MRSASSVLHQAHTSAWGFFSCGVQASASVLASTEAIRKRKNNFVHVDFSHGLAERLLCLEENK